MDLTSQASQARPSRHIAPTSKLTDDNNKAQPELAFQRKAVQDYRIRQAQEAKSLLNQLSPDAASPTVPTTKPQLKRNLSVIIDTDTEDGERDGRGVTEQLKPRMSSLVHLKPKKAHSPLISGKKQRIIPTTTNVSQTKHVVIDDANSDGEDDADREPVKRA